MTRKRIVHYSVGVFILILLVAVLNAIMISFDANEHMYIAASYLINENKGLYKDFAYVQMPYLPFCYACFHKLVHTSYYLLVGKCFSFFFFSLSALVVFLASRRISRALFFPAAVVILYLLNHTLVFSSAESSNYAMPLAFSFLGFYAYVSSVTGLRVRPFLAFLSGIFIACAIGAKLYYALIILPFILSAILFPRSERPKRRMLLVLSPLVVGIVLGLLPALYSIIRNYDVFMFNNIGFHNINSVLFRNVYHYQYNMSLFSKIQFAKTVFLGSENLILLACIVIAFVYAYFGGFHRTAKKIIDSTSVELFLSFFLVVSTIPIVFVPTPTWLQYFAVPVSFGFLLLISTYPLIPQSERFSYKCVIISFVLLASVDRGPWLMNHFRNDWVGIRMHEASQRMRKRLEQERCQGKMATLSSIYAVEAGVPIYRELSTGPFLFRLGDLLTPEQRERFHATSPETISKLFDEDPPASILVGFAGDSDTPLRTYAKEHGYRIAAGDFDGGELYLRAPSPGNDHGHE